MNRSSPKTAVSREEEEKKRRRVMKSNPFGRPAAPLRRRCAWSITAASGSSDPGGWAILRRAPPGFPLNLAPKPLGPSAPEVCGAVRAPLRRASEGASEPWFRNPAERKAQRSLGVLMAPEHVTGPPRRCMKHGKLDPLNMQKWYPMCGESFEMENACAWFCLLCLLGMVNSLGVPGILGLCLVSCFWLPACR
jgi:hypothetical protein